MARTAERIGRYVVESELGRGAFGVVYRAHRADDPDRPVALKVVENRGNLDRLMLEPALLSRVTHPCVVRLEDYFLSDDRLVLALEFVPGEDLKTSLDRGETLTPTQVRELLVQMAGALVKAHEAGIIHRDIKLSNILVDRGGGRTRFVLTDFGIGRQGEGIQVQKHTGGTYAFMAPEQLRGRPVPQSDLWALGVVAYRLLTGKFPFPGQTLAELSHQILYSTPEPPSHSPAGQVDAELEAVVLRLLEKSLTARTASAVDLLKDLGHRGAADTVIAADRRPPAAKSKVSLDRRLDRGMARYLTLSLLLAFLYVAQRGMGSGVLLVAGVALFCFAQGSGRWSRAARWGAMAGSLLLLLLSSLLAASQQDFNLLAYAPTLFNGAVLWARNAIDSETFSMVAEGAFFALAILVVLLIIFLMPATAYCYSEYRRHRREKALRRAALDAGDDPDKYLASLRAFVDFRFEDVGFHLKYVEALLARGRVKEAAVEARVLLEQDPYNFNGNLLLANAYFSLGLLDDCAAVCDRYLEVAGYCFEFGELREACARRLGVSP